MPHLVKYFKKQNRPTPNIFIWYLEVCEERLLLVFSSIWRLMLNTVDIFSCFSVNKTKTSLANMSTVRGKGSDCSIPTCRFLYVIFLRRTRHWVTSNECTALVGVRDRDGPTNKQWSVRKAASVCWGPVLIIIQMVLILNSLLGKI